MTGLRVLLVWLLRAALTALGVAAVVWVIAVLVILAGGGKHP